MEFFNSLNLTQIKGGTKLKQGDLGSVLSYSLTDENGQEITSFDNKTAYINLVLDDKIWFTTTTLVDISRVTFRIDKAIPIGLYYLEIKIDDYIFPSDRDSIILIEEGSTPYDLKELVPNYDINMTLKGILSDLSQKGIDINDLKTKMNAIYNNALADHAEITAARGSYPNLKSRLDEADNKQKQATEQLAQKANKDEVTNVMTPKGNIAYASLPMTGNSVGWYYYCPDGDGTHGAGNYVWNGTSWYFGGTGDEGYNLLKKDLKYVKTSNLLNHSKVLKDKRVNPWNGVTINDYTYDREGSYASPIIDVEPNKQYCFVKNNSIVALANNIGLILFGQDGLYVTDKLTPVNNIYTIPENIYYVAFCTNGNDFSTYNFKEYTNEMNLSYEEYGYRPKRIEDLEQGIEDLGQEVNNIKNGITKRKTIVLMNFDAPARFCEDGRYELVEKYNIPCTLNVTISGATSVSKPSKFKEMLYKGYDFATYGGYNAPDVSTINSENESDLLAWDTFVKNSKNAAETVGVFNPTAWFCGNGKTGTALNKALINNGYKIARGYIVEHPIDKGYLIRRENYNNRDPLKCNIEFTGLYPQSYETMLSALDEAIAGGYDIAPFTHGINPDEESATANYGITYELLESFLQVLREKADNGEIVLMTFREYYKTYYEADGQLNDYSRLLKTTEFFHNN